MIKSRITWFLFLMMVAAGCESRVSEKAFFEERIDKNLNLLEKARGFDQQKVLRSLERNSKNGFYYRFDDALQDARADTEISLDERPGFLLSLNFDTRMAVPGESGEIVAASHEGLLHFKKTRDVTLMFRSSLPKAQVGRVEIRARHTRGRCLYLGFNSKQGKGEEKVQQIDVVPDGKFHTYSVDIHSLLAGLRFGDEVKTLFLCPSDVEEKGVAIDYIRFFSKRHQYEKSLYGVRTETKNNETRAVLYTHTPLSLTYRVQIPAQGGTLSFGLGILERPVSFSVTINGERVFRQTASRTDRWEDARVDLDRYAGGPAEITFETAGEEDPIAFWSNPVLYGRREKAFNVIMVLEDALRADHLSCYGYPRATTPVKDELFARGVIFKNAFAQATKTRPSCPSIMTSLYPTATGVWGFYEKLSDAHLTLAEIFRSQGFCTAAFIQNLNLGPEAGMHQGYSRLFDDSGSSAKHMYLEQVPRWLEENRDRNFFLYLHVLDPHGPYNPPEDMRGWFEEQDRDAARLPKNTQLYDPPWVEAPSLAGRRALYDGEVKNNDRYFRRLLDKLSELNALDNTLLVFLSDHGEHLGEHDLWEHLPPGYVQAIKTPLMFVWPEGVPQNRVIDEPVQNIDIMPTVLDLAGIKTDRMLLQGDSLLPLMTGQPTEDWKQRLVLSEEVVDKDKNDDSPWASIIAGTRHVLSSKSVGMKQFDYIRDPGELSPLALQSETAEYYKAFIQAFQKANMDIWRSITRNGEDAIQWNPEVVERLKSMGYM